MLTFWTDAPYLNVAEADNSEGDKKGDPVEEEEVEPPLFALNEAAVEVHSIVGVSPEPRKLVVGQVQKEYTHPDQTQRHRNPSSVKHPLIPTVLTDENVPETLNFTKSSKFDKIRSEMVTSPIDCDEHHGPERSEAAEHAENAADFAQQGVSGQERVPVEDTPQHEHIHGHHPQVTHRQIGNQHVRQLSQLLHYTYRHDYWTQKYHKAAFFRKRVSIHYALWYSKLLHFYKCSYHFATIKCSDKKGKICILLGATWLPLVDKSKRIFLKIRKS